MSLFFNKFECQQSQPRYLLCFHLVSIGLFNRLLRFKRQVLSREIVINSLRIHPIKDLFGIPIFVYTVYRCGNTYISPSIYQHVYAVLIMELIKYCQVS